MPLPLKIFINYRRDDRPELVKKISDQLAFRYDDDNVFMDLNIPNFTRFQDHLEENVRESDVLIVFIGPSWLELLEERATTGEPDILVGEIEQALGQIHTLVATICIDGADIPPKNSLPANIREMVEFQIPDFRDGDEFMTSLHTIATDIEREYERRGLGPDRLNDLDTILHLPYADLEEYVLKRLEEGNRIRIEKHLRDFPDYLIGVASESAIEHEHDVNSLLEGITVFGTEFIKYGELELFQKLIRALHLTFEGAYKRFSELNRVDPRTHIIWNKLIVQLYCLGSIALVENKLSWLPYLLNNQITWKTANQMKTCWILHLQRNRARNNGSEANRLLKTIVDEIKLSTKQPYFLQQFSNDEESLTDCICQFDFIHCLFVDTDNRERRYSRAWPYFGLYFLDRIAPIFEKMIVDPGSRHTILGSSLSDQELASNFARYSHEAQIILQQTNNWMRMLWNDSSPQPINDFLNNHLTQEDLTKLRYL